MRSELLSLREALVTKQSSVVPGFIDLHTHLREPGFEYKEDIESGSRAALAGGFVTILCMPNTNPVVDCVQVVNYIQRRAREVGLVKIFPVGAMSKGLLGKEPADIVEMANAGIIAISDDGMCIQDGALMRRVMKLAKENNLLVIDHAEDTSRPDYSIESENTMIERDLKLARETKTRLHITHVSNALAIELIREAKKSGVDVSCDVTPHHLLLTEDAIVKYGANAKMKPPLRTERDRLALIKGLKDSTVDAIATDHAPHADYEKKDFESAEFGVIGMETAFPVCMKLVEEGHITFERLIELFTTGPARVLGLKNDSANTVTLDLATKYKIDSGKFKSKSRNTPFDGWNVKGKIVSAALNGRFVQ